MKLQSNFKFKQEIIDQFEDLGYDDMEQWPELTDDELAECGVSKGHLRKWRKQYANPTVPEELNVTTSNYLFQQD